MQRWYSKPVHGENPPKKNTVNIEKKQKGEVAATSLYFTEYSQSNPKGKRKDHELGEAQRGGM